MTATITFGSLTLMSAANMLPVAGKRAISNPVTIEDTVVLSGKHSIQTNANYGWEETYGCMGTYTTYLALLALVGQKLTLSVSTIPESHTNCAIKSLSSITETDDPNYYYWTVGFVQETI